MNTTPVTVRQIWSEEVDLVTPLFCQYLDFYNRPASPEIAGAYLQARLVRQECVIYLAQVGDIPAGFAQLYPTFDSIFMRRIWVLYDLFVAPAQRRQGVAGALLTQARQLGQTSDAAFLTLATERANHAAQALYERHGWERDDEFFVYELPLTGA